MSALQAVREGAALCRRPELRTLLLEGPDRVRFLNGMLTQDVRALGPGQSALALKVSAKGRIEASVRVRATEDRLLLEVRALRADKLLRTLEQHMIMDDCSIRDVSSERTVLSLLGPASASLLGALLGAPLPALEVSDGPQGGVKAPARSGLSEAIAPAGGLTSPTTGPDAFVELDGLTLHVPPARADALFSGLERLGAAPISEAELEIVRIERGVPVDGPELDEDTLPMEAKLSAAVSLEKGCYVGQEVIARGTNLGGVQYGLVGVALGAQASPPGTSLYAGAEDKPQGELCSVCYSPRLGQHIALAYVRKAHEAPGTELWAGPLRHPVRVSALPFVED
jgi:folate-binding protein YgfZ